MQRCETGLYRAPPELGPQLGGGEVRGPTSAAVSAGVTGTAAVAVSAGVAVQWHETGLYSTVFTCIVIFLYFCFYTKTTQKDGEVK